MQKKIDQIKAVMLGHAVADALGVPVEFCSRDELKKQPVTDMVGYGTYPVPAGSWSDDTSMSLAALDCLACGNFDANEIMINFVKWLESGAYTPTGECFDVGCTCQRAIQNFIGMTYTPEEQIVIPVGFDATVCGIDGERNNGNGALMRIHPFALMIYFDKSQPMDFEPIIDRACALTHAHARSKLACEIYTLILHHLLAFPNKDAVLLALDIANCRYYQHPEYRHFERLLGEGFENLAEDQIKSSGYVVDTLEAAIWCLLTTDNYRECVLKAVNLGDDTDTVAAVAGGLAGAMYGYDSVPLEWKNTLIKREYIEAICERAGKTWLSNDLKKDSH